MCKHKTFLAVTAGEGWKMLLVYGLMMLDERQATVHRCLYPPKNYLAQKSKAVKDGKLYMADRMVSRKLVTYLHPVNI